MKKIVAISLFIFFVVIAAIIVAGLLLKNQKELSNKTSDKIVLTVEEVAKHNLASDCWTIVNNKVYNVTSLLNTHTAGADTIIPSCGKDGSIAFNTKNKPEPKPHSENANNIMNQYYLGNLVN